MYGVDVFPGLLKDRGLDPNNLPKADIREYINDMDDCLAAADLMISRSGALTLSELQAAGRASILIPSPNVAENHQYHNAMVLANNNAAIVIEEKDLTGKKLCETVEEPERIVSRPSPRFVDSVLHSAKCSRPTSWKKENTARSKNVLRLRKKPVPPPMN